jgi:hypothetical protein
MITPENTPAAPHIDQVRTALLGILNDLHQRKDPADIDRAKAMAAVGSVLVDTARVENEYIKLTGQERSNFMESSGGDDGQLGLGFAPGQPTAHNPFPVSARHLLGE